MLFKRQEESSLRSVTVTDTPVRFLEQLSQEFDYPQIYKKDQRFPLLTVTLKEESKQWREMKFKRFFRLWTASAVLVPFLVFLRISVSKQALRKYFLTLIAVEEIRALQASAVPQEGIPGAGSATAGA